MIPLFFTDQMKVVTEIKYTTFLTNIPRILLNKDLLIFVPGPALQLLLSFHHEKCQKRH
jgi:hypothetical protein